MTNETYRTYYRGHRIILEMRDPRDETWAYEITGPVVRHESHYPSGMDSYDADWEAYRAACKCIDAWIAKAGATT